MWLFLDGQCKNISFLSLIHLWRANCPSFFFQNNIMNGIKMPTMKEIPNLDMISNPWLIKMVKDMMPRNASWKNKIVPNVKFLSSLFSFDSWLIFILGQGRRKKDVSWPWVRCVVHERKITQPSTNFGYPKVASLSAVGSDRKSQSWEELVAIFRWANILQLPIAKFMGPISGRCVMEQQRLILS